MLLYSTSIISCGPDSYSNIRKDVYMLKSMQTYVAYVTETRLNARIHSVSGLCNIWDWVTFL